MLKKCKTDEFMVEILGTLANLTSSQFDWSKLLVEYDLVDFLSKHLVPGYCEDGILLEVIILIGTTIVDKKCAKIVINSPIVPALVDLLNRMFIARKLTCRKTT